VQNITEIVAVISASTGTGKKFVH